MKQKANFTKICRKGKRLKNGNSLGLSEAVTVRYATSYLTRSLFDWFVQQGSYEFSTKSNIFSVSEFISLELFTCEWLIMPKYLLLLIKHINDSIVLN